MQAVASPFHVLSHARTLPPHHRLLNALIQGLGRGRCCGGKRILQGVGKDVVVPSGLGHIILYFVLGVIGRRRFWCIIIRGPQGGWPTGSWIR